MLIEDGVVLKVSRLWKALVRHNSFHNVSRRVPRSGSAERPTMGLRAGFIEGCRQVPIQVWQWSIRGLEANAQQELVV